MLLDIIWWTINDTEIRFYWYKLMEQIKGLQSII